ncbi:MAG: nucleoside deaminase [Bacteriovoracaceae bacterium]|nr:nucleoside deaminase [Bacteriovoracaceae bacterium]
MNLNPAAQLLRWENFMDQAIQEAQIAFDNQEVPVGAIVVDENFREISRARNLKEAAFNPCGHAEIYAITEAAQKMKNWRLTNCHLVVSLEPCPMCMAAIQQARLETVIFGAFDKKGGAISLGFHLHNDARLNHQMKVVGGVKGLECGELLSRFFRERREKYNSVLSSR